MTTARWRLLVMDDEPRIRNFVARGLSAEGHHVDMAADGQEGLRKALAESYHLVILDLLMPGEDGVTALRKLLASKPEQPVLVLSCLADPATKVECFDLGAADYMAKPFSFDELLARVRARLRDEERRASVRDSGHQPGGFTRRAGRVTLDLLRREVDVGNGGLPLTEREFLLLAELLDRPGEVVSKQRLLSSVWGYHFDPDSNLVDVCVWRLRTKLGHDLIKTVRGRGYAINA